MLNYCIDRLEVYAFQESPEYGDKFEKFDAEFQFIKKHVIDLLHMDASSKKTVNRIDYLNQLSNFINKLTIYKSAENNKNMQYIGLMITLLHYNTQQDSLMSSMNLIDYC